MKCSTNRFRASQNAKRIVSSSDFRTPFQGYSFDAASLIAIADLSTIARRTALLGSVNLLNTLVLCPGIHRQQKASDLNKGEYPATVALATGYVFRIQNQATVAYLQHVGITGQLVTLTVESVPKGSWYRFRTAVYGPGKSACSTVLVLVATLASTICIILLAVAGDWWGFALLLSLVGARSLNIILIHRRTKPSWHGALEPGVKWFPSFTQRGRMAEDTRACGCTKNCYAWKMAS